MFQSQAARQLRQNMIAREEPRECMASRAQHLSLCTAGVSTLTVPPYSIRASVCCVRCARSELQPCFGLQAQVQPYSFTCASAERLLSPAVGFFAVTSTSTPD
jgi:hypothetical protein